MISFVRGQLAYINENSVEIDVGGVGYEVFVPTTVLSELPSKGNEVELYTYLNVKEDEMTLFGFLSRDALSVFKHLISVQIVLVDVDVATECQFENVGEQVHAPSLRLYGVV